MTPPTSGRRTPPVLIVGAGPTGLALGNALAAYGVPFDIIDAKAGPERDSKALALNAASLYGLELLGIGSQVGAGGAPLRRATLHWQGRRFAAIDFWRASPRWGSFVAQPQAETERDLEAALNRQGHQVARSVRLERLVPSDDHVEVMLTALPAAPDCEGPVQHRRYDYVVGCDGKHSVVARTMGANFQASEYAMHFVLGDFPMHLDLPPDEASYHVWDDLFFIFVPLGRGLWRVVLQREGPVPAAPARPDELMQVVTRRLGREVFRGPPVWLSRAPFYQRFADRLRQGRLLLAGDAAHLYSPIGGTGMNTGLQDAFHLAWRLAYLTAGVGPDSLLDGYERLRMEAMRANGEATDRSTRLITRLERDPAPLAPLLPSMKNRPLARQTLPLAYTGLALRYPSLQARHPGCGGLCLGWPALRQALDRQERRERRRPALPALHLLLGSPPSEALPPALSCALTARAGALKCVALGGTHAPAAPPWTVLADDSGQGARQAGLAQDEALLLLPDGIVAWRGRWPDAAAGLIAELEAWLPLSPTLAEAFEPAPVRVCTAPPAGAVSLTTAASSP